MGKKMKLDYRFRRFWYNLVNGSAGRLIKVDYQMKHNIPSKVTFKFDYDSFMNVQREMIKQGHFLAAQLYAETSLKDVADDDKDKTGCYQSLRIRKHIWDGNIIAARRTAEKMKARMIRGSEHYDRLSTLCYGFLGGEFEKTMFSRQYPYYEEMYRNKKIAVIGPAVDEEYNIDEINKDFDVIVLFNHKRPGTICNYKKQPGIKVVSYYHSENYYKIVGENIGVFSELDGAVLPCDGKELLSNIEGAEKKIRSFLNFDGLLMGGVFNLAQHIIVDLIQFQPKEIKLYGCNLFLDKHDNPYGNDYISNDARAIGQNLFDAFAFHVLGLNYELLYMMYQNKMFKATEMLKDVLSIGTHRYLSEMEKRYPKENL